MSALASLLGKPGDPLKCRVISADLAVHWFAAAARTGDPCLCGKTIMREPEEEPEDAPVCACHCPCTASVDFDGDRCPMCSEACGPDPEAGP